MSLLLSVLLVLAFTLAGALALRRALRRAQAALGTVWLGHGCEQLAEPAPLWRSSLEAAPQGRQQVDPTARTIVPPPVRLTVHRGGR